MPEGKGYKIPSRSFEITGAEAADILATAQEIIKNKPLHKAAITHLKAKQKAIKAAL